MQESVSQISDTPLHIEDLHKILMTKQSTQVLSSKDLMTHLIIIEREKIILHIILWPHGSMYKKNDTEPSKLTAHTYVGARTPIPGNLYIPISITG